MKVDSIKNGIVIDHITPGKAMQLYNMLGLDALDCSVAVIKNVSSKKMGKKDIIKVDSCIDCNLDVVGFVSPNATINIIEGGKLAEKKYIDMPGRLVNIIKCKNPRCITTTEQDIEHIFELTDKESTEYRCIYCDTKAELGK
ncbi:MAG: aspartate carbamoyltransferase regulatory subunit [Clostridia bacterium]|nr:aspartate carbamoyltransferase regulatory subunit [Clostridia bacterium]